MCVCVCVWNRGVQSVNPRNPRTWLPHENAKARSPRFSGEKEKENKKGGWMKIKDKTMQSNRTV